MRKRSGSLGGRSFCLISHTQSSSAMDNADSTGSKRSRHNHVCRFLVFPEKTVQGSSGEQPEEIGNRSGERQEYRNFQDVPVFFCVRQGVGCQCRDAENHDFDVGDLHEKTREKIAAFPGFCFTHFFVLQDVIGEPKDISRADPCQCADRIVDCRSENPDGSRSEQRDHGKAEENSAPLSQGLPLARISWRKPASRDWRGPE